MNEFDRTMICGHTPEDCNCDPTPEQDRLAAVEEAYWDGEGDYEPECCPHCGKDYEEFSDLGCEFCDARHPGFGVTP